ncbi:unnamed protein product [Allacma fusca]|uniref:TFIIS N-terminal domain-containing protein n=1 Tax=Allacma fusca TaxID=39272 RepID=A0A8J2K7N5_9HEXA|nr:unnamed protein product [Allacma fusca]
MDSETSLPSKSNNKTSKKSTSRSRSGSKQSSAGRKKTTKVKLSSGKSRTRSESCSPVRPAEDQGSLDGNPQVKDENEGLSDFDLMLERKKEEKTRHKKRKYEDLVNVNENLIAQFVEDMRSAAEDDRDLNEAGKPSTKKIAMLPSVLSQLRKPDLQPEFFEHNVLMVLTDWLAPMPDRSLPASSVRESILKLLADFPHLEQYLLKESGIGKAVMYLLKHPKETKGNKELAGKIVGSWARPIFDLSTDYRALSKEEREQRDFDQKPKRLRIIADHDRKLHAQDMSRMQSSNLEPGDPGWIPRALVPQPSSKDYVVRPKWLSDVSLTAKRQKKQPTLFDKHVKAFSERNKLLKTIRAVTIMNVIVMSELILSNFSENSPEELVLSDVAYEIDLQKTCPKMFILLHPKSESTYQVRVLANKIQSMYLRVPIFGLIFYEMNKYFGHYICWFPENCEVRFWCTSMNCLETMINVYEDATHEGRQISWEWEEVCSGGDDFCSIIKGSPFQRNNPRPLFPTMYSFLTEEVNFNVSEEAKYFMQVEGLAPGILFQESGKNHYFETEFRIAEVTSFNFITSDSVGAVKLEFSLYTKPFEISVWQSIGSALFFAALILSTHLIFTGDLVTGGHQNNYGREEMARLTRYVLWASISFDVQPKLVLIVQGQSKIPFANRIVHDRHKFFQTVPKFILIRANAQTGSYFSGYYVCNFILECKVHFRCSTEDCLTTMLGVYNQVTNYGKKIVLQIINFSGQNEPRSTFSGSPLRRDNPWGILKTMHYFLIEDHGPNVSISAKIRRSDLPETTIFIFEYPITQMQLFLIAQSTPFNFITSDSVRAMTVRLSLYANPLQRFVWLALGLSMALTALTMTIHLHKYGTPKHIAFLMVAFSLCANLVEQGTLVMKRGNKLSQSRIATSVAIIWLFLCLIISNGYKGLLKTSFATQNRFTSRWQYLDQLQDFTFYLPAGDYNEGYKWHCRNTSDDTCVRHCRSSDVSASYRSERDNFLDSTTFQRSSKYLSPRQFRCVARDSLKHLIQGNLSSPKTALVVFSFALGYYWNHVQKVMDEEGLQFAHNGDVLNDAFLRRPYYLQITRAFSEEYNYVGRRARIMLSSGMFWFWQKWDNIRFPRRLFFHMKTRRDTSPKPLSMNSSLMLVLYVYCWCTIVCAVVFIVEVMLWLRNLYPKML